MTLTPRPYAGEHDLVQMKRLLVAGKQVSPFSGYVHPGDLDWWVYYDTSGQPLTERVWLWEEHGELLGWVFTWPGYEAFDLFIHPSMRGQLEEIVLDWMEANLPSVFQRKYGKPLETLETYAYADNPQLIDLLKERGYTESPSMVLFRQSLAHVPTPLLPPGFSFLERMDAANVEQRTAVHVSAFTRLNPDGSIAFKSKMTPDYYRKFMTAPGYDPELDVVVVAPDGAFASFVMAWADATLKMGEFEPVGTHADYRRRGLGKAALLEAMRRLRARGMDVATVMTWAKDEGNIAFYQSAGFAIHNHILRFSKVLPRKRV
ncbi:MAG: GNAT family N-acetyltransferase [Anaerolineaceae bacterium]|nr:GNAT family N-acetyltransferase [Anaerolineaceae bacterium]